MVRLTSRSSRRTSTTSSTRPTRPSVRDVVAALRPRGRVRHRGGLRPRRRDARRLGRPARGAGRRLACSAPRPTRPSAPGPARWAGSRQGAVVRRARHASAGDGAAGPASAHRRRTRSRAARRAGRALRHAGRPARGHPRRGGRPGQGGRRGGRTTSATGPVVVGPVVPTTWCGASISARAATAGLRAAPGWPDAPRPVTSDDLLPERALSGDGHARRQLVEEVYLPARRRPARRPDRDALGVPRPRRLDRGHRAGAVRARQHRALPAAAGRRGHRPDAHRPARRLHLRVALTLGRLPAGLDGTAEL